MRTEATVGGTWPWAKGRGAPTADGGGKAGPGISRGSPVVALWHHLTSARRAGWNRPCCSAFCPLFPWPQGANTGTFGPDAFSRAVQVTDLATENTQRMRLLMGTLSVVGGRSARSPSPDGPLHTGGKCHPPQAPFSSKSLFILDSFAGIFHQANLTHSCVEGEGEGGGPGSG